MPAWETYNFKLGYQVINGGTFFAGVENILDTQYRVFASGINAPGRNIYAGVRYNFNLKFSSKKKIPIVLKAIRIFDFI